MIRNKALFAALTAACLSAAPLARAAAGGGAKDVEKLVRTSVDKILTILKDESLDRTARREKVLEVVEPVLDIKLMAKLSLGRKHWPKLNKAQRKTFTDLFVEQLKASYFEKLDLFTDEKVEYAPPVAKGRKFTMTTYILSKADRIGLAYKLYKRGGEWKVYDMEIEGVSIVKSYSSQYDEFLRNGSPEDLLEKMRENIRAAREDVEKDGKKAAPPTE